jgi:hypothetical protein
VGKNPAFLFYPADWQRDLTEHPLEMEGALIRICCKLWFSETPGRMTKPLRRWSKLLGLHHNTCLKVFSYLSSNHLCNIEVNQDLYTIVNIRLEKEAHILKVRQEAGKKGGNPMLIAKKVANLLNQTDNQKPTLSVSSSVSSSIEQNTLEQWWGIYPKRNGKRVGRKECFDFIRANLSVVDMELLLKATASYAKSSDPIKGFAKDPIRFLKKDYWKDFIEPDKQPSSTEPDYDYFTRG